MAYVVTQGCIDNKHTNCVDVCPVEAFREGPDMLYIDPTVCIDCNACLTECPERAIFPQSAVPEDMVQFIELNAEKAKEFPVIRESIDKQASTQESALTGRFAVVGSGPSGFYAAEAILKQMPTAEVDIFERLPTPFGLVRFGVAPDHPRIKSVSAGFERIAESPQVRFFGNVNIGEDISTEELRQHYHSVVYATGGSKSRALTIPGADLNNIFGSSEFVGWYNGHPDHQSLSPSLSQERAAIIGIGNVALDIARILLLPAEELKQTDIADGALAAITDSNVNEVCLIARRGAMQAAFTPKELEQLMGIESIDLLVNPDDLILDAESTAQLELPEFSEAKQNMALLHEIANRTPSQDPARKRIRFVFCHQPLEISEANGTRNINLGVNELQRDDSGRVQAVATGKTEQLEVGLVINATGYQGQAVGDLPFDEKRGVIANDQSRVETGEKPQDYVAGWIKRGASGVIGSNKHCATETVQELVKNLSEDSGTIESDITDLLQSRAVNFIDFEDWKLLDAYEQEQGKKEGRPRRKETDVKRMLDIIREAKSQQEAEREALANQPVKTHFRSCTLCEAMCGVKIEYQGDKIISIAGDPEDTHSWGHICPKGYSLQDLHNDPDRIKKPMQKVDGQWLEISWEEALDITAERLVGIQQQYGNDAVAGYWGNPTSHNFGLLMATGKIRKVLQSRNLFTAASLDQMPHQLHSYLMFGHGQVFTIPDVDRTDYMLMLGANPAASNGSLMSGGDILKRLEGIKERGGKLVLIDPRKNESALYASEHHFIRPATDGLFLIGLIQQVIKNDRCKPGRLKDMIDNWDVLLELFDTFSLEEISSLCGIPEAEIIRIADEFSSAESAVCYGRMGISTQTFSTLNHWLISVLNIITGNLDRPGGMMFNDPAMNSSVQARTAGSFATYGTRVRGLPEFNREFPASAMAEEMLTPGEGQVKGLICIAGNPALSTPNGTQLEQALEQLDFIVSVDFYINETSRHADIILPPTGPLEHEQFDLVFNLLSVHNVAKFSEPLFEHGPEALSDWDIVMGLVKRISTLKGMPVKDEEPSPRQILDYSLRTGPYGESFDEYLDNGEVIHHPEGLSLDKLKQFEHGLNLGPMKPRLPEHLFTEDKKIHVTPEPLLADFERFKAEIKAQVSSKSLMLIGRRDLRTNNSWMHNSQRLVKGKDRCALFVNPEDAKQLGLVDRSRAKVCSRVGELLVDVKVTEDVMPGVVCLPHGWGHDREGGNLRVAQTNPGINKNDLTDDQLLDKLSGNAVLNGVPVEVMAV